jgi:hypothetical protein
MKVKTANNVRELFFKNFGLTDPPENFQGHPLRDSQNTFRNTTFKLSFYKWVIEKLLLEEI